MSSNYQKTLTDVYVLFWASIYSNWYKSKFEVDNITYNSVEQFMMACKAILFNDEISLAKIMRSNNVKEIRAFGREVIGYDDEVWTKARLSIVIKGVYEKFIQNESLKEEMLLDFSRGERSFVEASPKYEVWGVGLAAHNKDVLDFSKWQGTNLLGIATDFVASRILIESGDCDFKVPLGVEMILAYLPLTSASSIQCVEMAVKQQGYNHHMDFDDYMHGGVILYDTLESLSLGERPDNK